jgi:hypothetical protein
MAKKRLIPGNYYALRFQVLERDGFTCQYCGQRAPNVTLEVDHIKPISDGGTDEMDNLATTCRACNRGKGGLQIQRRHHNQKQQSPRILKEPHQAESKIYSVLQQQQGLRPSEIASILGHSPRGVGVSLSRLKQRGMALNVRRGIWIALPI